MPENQTPHQTVDNERLEKKVDAIFVSVEKTRKYFLATLIISLLMFVLPLIALLFIIPSMIATYTSVLGGV